ncbi:MAG: 6,7-dimethyl-8-ribityllumazine synthase [Sulfuricurvum sp. PC08-66]|nr:MAG: 6,7-dimethyl-8-ribityllumazine synthase [Sulfuricurvum sp. PC08-66]
MNKIEGNLHVTAGKVAIIASRFNAFFVDRLIEGAQDAYVRHGGDESKLDLVMVPGAFELPFALDKLLSTGHYDAVCCVGAVIRGATPHFDYVSAEATKGIANVALKYQKPVSFGLLTTDNQEQTMERSGSKAGNKGFEAMTTLIEMMNLYKVIG